MTPTSLRRFPRIALRALLAVLALVAALGSVATVANAQADPEFGAPTTPDGDVAIDELVGCVQGSRQLLVLFLMDESKSLKGNDPEAQRVEAARGALESLVALGSSSGDASPQVNVAMAAFSNEYRLVQDWTPADADGAQELDDAVGQFADLNDGTDTDFVNALTAGREALADEAAAVTAAGATPPCRAILLFTDGGYDIAVRETPEAQEELGTTKVYAPGIELTTSDAVLEAEAAGKAALCDPGGVADQVRDDKVTLLTVALSANVPRSRQRLLAAATAGTADDFTCGTPSDRATGSYLAADGVDVLVTRFNDVGARLAGGNALPGRDDDQVCAEEGCDEGTEVFSLDESLRRAQVFALPPKPGATIVITGPKNTTARISEPGTVQLGTTEVTSRQVAGRGWVVDIERPEDLEDWTGEWSASLVDTSGDQAGEPAALQVFVFSDIGINVGAAAPLERGGTTGLQAQLMLPEGVEATDVVEAADVRMRLTDPIAGTSQTVELVGPPEGPFIGTFDTPADTTSNSIEARVEATITTQTGAVLESRSAVSELLVRRPAGAIQFTPPSLEMPSLTGTGSTESELLLVGGTTAGCIWFGETDVPDAPEGAGEVVFTTGGEVLPGEADCIPVEADGRVTVPIEATVSGRASGTVRGSLQVFEKTDGVEATTTDMVFRFDLARGVDETQRLLLALALLVGGLAIPLIALIIINAVTARFQRLDAVRGAAVPVVISARSISRTDGSVPRTFGLTDKDFGNLGTSGNDRQFAFGGVVFRARASRNPFGPTIALAAPEGGAEKLKGRAGSRVELDPALAGSWIFLLDADKTRLAARGEAHGLLIAFVAEGSVGDQVAKMMPDVTDRLPTIASRLAGLVRQVKGKDAPTPRSQDAVEPEPDPAPEPEPEPIVDEVVEPEPEPEPAPAPEPAPEAPDDPEEGPPPSAPLGFGGPRG